MGIKNSRDITKDHGDVNNRNGLGSYLAGISETDLQLLKQNRKRTPNLPPVTTILETKEGFSDRD